jgi:hypothetical protein
MFDVVTGVISQLQNVSANINQSTEDWLVQVQKNLDEFGKAMAKGMAEYEKAETEAFDILKRGGWLGMERHLTGPQVRSFLEISRASGEPAANSAIIGYFTKNNCALLETMSNGWLDVSYMKLREAIVGDALAAHRARQFSLSVPALLPLAEGLSAEIMAGAAGKQNVVKAVARQWRAQEQEVWTELYSEIVLHVLYKNYDFDKDPAPYLNRNGILHGRISDYGTEANSVRVFLFLDSVVDLWRAQHKKKPGP